MIKLKLQVDLTNRMDVNDDGLLIDLFKIYITVLDKDERFDIGSVSNTTGNTLLYNGTGTFIIKTSEDKKLGGILSNGLLIPSLDKIGIEYNKTFYKEEERYEYLKKLYTSVKEWSNYWWGFCYDDKSKLTIKNNIWEVNCDKVYNGSMDYLLQSVNI